MVLNVVILQLQHQACSIYYAPLKTKALEDDGSKTNNYNLGWTVEFEPDIGFSHPLEIGRRYCFVQLIYYRTCVTM